MDEAISKADIVVTATNKDIITMIIREMKDKTILCNIDIDNEIQVEL